MKPRRILIRNLLQGAYERFANDAERIIFCSVPKRKKEEKVWKMCCKQRS